MRDLTLLDFKTVCKATVTKTVQSCIRIKRQMGHTWEPRHGSILRSSLDFRWRRQSNSMQKGRLLYQRCWTDQRSLWEKMSLTPYLVLDMKVNLKCITDINVKSNLLRPLGEHKGEYIHGLGVGEGFLGHRRR